MANNTPSELRPKRIRPVDKWDDRGKYRSRSFKEAVEAFWLCTEVRSESECWPWRYGKVPKGYGTFYWGTNWMAHRFAWFISNPNISLTKGMCVCHKCDNPGCVNPKHLFIGTVGDNNRDCIAKGRGNRASGTRRPNALLNEDQVREIFLTFARGMSNVMGKKYGVDGKIIRNVVNRKSYRNVTKNL